MWLSYFAPTDDAQLQARMNAWIGYRAPFDGWPPPARGHVPPVTQSGLAAENARLRAALDAATRRIETRTRLSLEMVDPLAHHLRTPLGLIKGFVGTMLNTDLLLSAHERQECLEVIDEETDILSHLVDQLLDLVILDAGTARVAARAVDVAALIHEAATPAPTHPLRLALAPALPAVWGEARKLRQVLAELVENARRFTPPGTPITLGAELTADGHAVRFTVRDAGPGLAAEVLPRVFDPFYRATGGQHRRIAGAGLGLTLARGWVEAHGGKMWAENAPDGGAAFHFTIPTAASRRRSDC
jgi:two-component system sensor histidine kinase KdpD